MVDRRLHKNMNTVERCFPGIYLPEEDISLKSLSRKITGPVLFAYVWWVLVQARERGFQRLYFLARDGYVLEKISRKFCEQFQLNIDCRYLYCSRASLRMPSYHLIVNEAFDLLLLPGYHLTAFTVLQRVNLTESERRKVYQEISFSIRDEHLVMTKPEFHAFAEKIKKSSYFRSLVQEKSMQSYDAAIGYLRQEGLMDGASYAIVDSGWTGSMQRSLRQLLESAGYTERLNGFYFGMFANPKEPRDGEYFTWYFNANTSKINKIFFCNNLFECMLSAPHGMTVGYKEESGNYLPILKNEPSPAALEQIYEQINGILAFADAALPLVVLENFNPSRLYKLTQKLLRRLMVHPTQKEAEIYGQFAFCDDVTEEYHMPLADKVQLGNLSGYMVLPRMIRKLFRIKQTRQMQEPFWPYGIIAFASAHLRTWYRLNIYVWEWLRYTLK